MAVIAPATSPPVQLSAVVTVKRRARQSVTSRAANSRSIADINAALGRETG
jgi:hypothetical protein